MHIPCRYGTVESVGVAAPLVSEIIIPTATRAPLTLRPSASAETAAGEYKLVYIYCMYVEVYMYVATNLHKWECSENMVWNANFDWPTHMLRTFIFNFIPFNGLSIVILRFAY